MQKKMFALALTVVLVAGLTAGLEATHASEAKSGGNFETSEIVQNPGSSFSLLFSFLQSPDSVRPGEKFVFDWEVTMQEQTDTGDALKIVEIYNCHDSGCDDPDRDVFVEASRDGVSFSTILEPGQTWSASTEYQVPSDAEEGTWGAVVYIWDREKGAVVSDTPETTFTVSESAESNPDAGIVDSDGDGFSDSTDACPQTPGVAANAGCPEGSSAPILPIVGGVLVLAGLGFLVFRRLS